MHEIQLKCQGLPCPQPVLKCKDIIEKQSPTKLSVVVDNEAAKINVSRFLSTRGYQVDSSDDNGNYMIHGTLSENMAHEACAERSNEEILSTNETKTLVFIASDVIGDGDDELGKKLMFNFISTLKEMGSDLWRIILLNGGVKLAVSGHPCVEPLQLLEESGISILVCGTCLEHFGLTSQNELGEVTNMLDVVTSMQLASKTIRV